MHDKTDKHKSFLQVWPRGDGVSWDLAYLSPSLDRETWAAKSWLSLLQLLMILACQRQIERVCARAPEDGAVEETLRRAGFTVLGREEIFCLKHAVVPTSAPKGLQRMSWRHRKAVRALYDTVYPRLQQQAEPMPPCADKLSYFHPAQQNSINEYVWQVDGRVMAYFGLAHGNRGSWLEVIVQPECRGDILPHIKYLAGQSDCSRQQPLHCAVPDHSVGLGWILRTLRFHTDSRQVSLVAYPRARIRVRHPAIVPGLEGRVDMGTPAQGIHG